MFALRASMMPLQLRRFTGRSSSRRSFHSRKLRTGYRYSVDVSIYVLGRARRSGIGTALYTRLFDLLAARGFHRAFAGVTLPNDASVALHRRFGFSEVGIYREAGYKFGRWLDVMWFQRSAGCIR
jgi:phosphinothricin acetyltransferase